jgi:hypothetical protein
MVSHAAEGQERGEAVVARDQPDRMVVIHQSDHGCLFTTMTLDRGPGNGRPPVSRIVGNVHDNAMAERGFATSECERIDRRIYGLPTDARLNVFQYIARVVRFASAKCQHREPAVEHVRSAVVSGGMCRHATAPRKQANLRRKNASGQTKFGDHCGIGRMR